MTSRTISLEVKKREERERECVCVCERECEGIRLIRVLPMGINILIIQDNPDNASTGTK